MRTSPRQSSRQQSSSSSTGKHVSRTHNVPASAEAPLNILLDKTETKTFSTRLHLQSDLHHPSHHSLSKLHTIIRNNEIIKASDLRCDENSNLYLECELQRLFIHVWNIILNNSGKKSNFVGPETGLHLACKYKKW